MSGKPDYVGAAADVMKRARKPRKKKAQLIAEARLEGFEAGREMSTGSLATLIVGAVSGCVGTLIFIAVYHALHALHG